MRNEHDDKDENKSLVKHSPSSDDGGFAGWTDEVEGDDRPQGAGVIQGKKLKFKDAKWVDRDNNDIPPDLEVAAVGIGRFVQRWEDGTAIETISVAAGAPFPDVDAMNEKIPRETWEDGPSGQPQGPYQACSVVYFIDLKTMDQYSFPAPTVTIGSSIAVRELRKTIVWMQKYRGANVFPIVKLSKAWMPTRHGGRMRPDFVKTGRWVRLGGGGDQVEALAPPSEVQQQLEDFAKPAEPELPLKEVQEPSLQEEMNDAIPDYDQPDLGLSEKATPPLPPARRNHKSKPGGKLKPRKAPAKNILDAG
jgi:hypothetical protein